MKLTGTVIGFTESSRGDGIVQIVAIDYTGDLTDHPVAGAEVLVVVEDNDLMISETPAISV